MAGLDYYRILGVPKAATAGDIRKAYHEAALKWHPDKNPGHHKEAERRFKQLLEAYEVLKDPVKRAVYDRLPAQEGLKRNVPPPPAAATERAASGGSRGAGQGGAPGPAKATGFDRTGGAKHAGSAGTGRAPGAARATGFDRTGGAKHAGGAGTGRAPGAAKATGCAGTGGSKRAGSADPGRARGAGAGGSGTGAASGARPGDAGYWGCRGSTFDPTGRAWSTNTGESERNEYCYRYHDYARAASDNLYGQDVRGGDFRHNYGAGVDDDFSLDWDFDDLDIDGCDENDYYGEYSDDWL